MMWMLICFLAQLDKLFFLGLAPQLVCDFSVSTVSISSLVCDGLY